MHNSYQWILLLKQLECMPIDLIISKDYCIINDQCTKYDIITTLLDAQFTETLGTIKANESCAEIILDKTFT